MRLSVRLLAACTAVALAGVACSDNGTDPQPPGPPATLAKTAGDNQTAATGAAVATKPKVKVTDADGKAISGVAVTFAVASGGGSITGGSATTGSDGTAQVGSWTLGAAAGANTLTATITATGVSGNPATFTATATATAPVAKTMTKQSGDAQSGTVSTAVPIPPSVKLVDVGGAPVSGVAVTFAVATGGGSITGATSTTNASGIAQVGSWTLGSAVGSNTLTATAVGTGITGNPATFTATAAAAGTPFNPTSNTNLTGTVAYSTVNIPAGVTVTMTGDVTMTATGAVTIAGTLTGNCVALNVTSDGLLTLSGTINNGCTGTPATFPAIVLAGKGGYNLNGGVMTAAGDVTITDDPTATDTDFPSLMASFSTPFSRAAAQSQAVPCNAPAFTGTTNPAVMPPNGVAGSPNGVNGGNAKTWTLRCKGGSDIIVGVLNLTGQDGGNGGTGTHTVADGAAAVGGNGGTGGMVKIQATGSIVIGGPSSITTGKGGEGGLAFGTATSNGGNKGGSATATGGNGGSPGLFGAYAGGGISFTGAVTLRIGSGGNGGGASATAADGHSALPCSPATGGDATANSGNGGSTPDKTLRANGNVTGLASLTVTGGAPGNAGNTTATAGKGGDGAQPCKNGAAGGTANSTGGAGGNALLKNALGALIANGGQGGSIVLVNGKGGQGWVDCILPVFEPGGNGGNGGSVGVRNGAGGTGLAAGSAGTVTYSAVANGGNGGNGVGPGAGGPPGGNGVTVVGGGAVIGLATSFIPGAPGITCVVPEEEWNLDMVFPVSSGVVNPGNYTNTLRDAVGTAVGTIVHGTVGTPSGNHFTAQSPRRVGWAGGGVFGWFLDLASLIVNAGGTWTITEYTECIINAQVDVSNPVKIQQLDVNGAEVASNLITANNTCATVPVNAKTKKIVTTGGKSGGFVDTDKKKVKGKKN